MHETIRQLQLLGELRRHLLPRHAPELPGWQIAVRHRIGRWAGGDYYDFLPQPDGRLLLLVAGGSDQGAPATALMAMLRVVTHSCPLSSGQDRTPFCPMLQPALQPPHVLLGHLNRVLAENSLEEQYLTAFCALLDPSDGSVQYASAGHPPPRVWRAGRNAAEVVGGPVGLPLGLEPTAAYHKRHLELGPGDLLLLYSEGVRSDPNPRGEVFGVRRLDEVLGGFAAAGAEAVAEEAMTGLKAFLGVEEPADDLTLLVVQRERECPGEGAP